MTVPPHKPESPDRSESMQQRRLKTALWLTPAREKEKQLFKTAPLQLVSYLSVEPINMLSTKKKQSLQPKTNPFQTKS